MAAITQLDPDSVHLINRASFGPKLEWLKKDTKFILENRNSALEWLFETIGEYSPVSQGNKYSFMMEEEKDDYNRLYQQAPIEGLICDWLSIMVSSPNPLREIVALFWHHHMPTGKGNYVEHGKLLLEIYRKYGLGRLQPLLIKTAANPAMMYWLDGHWSHKDNPNENFPRELLELFTLGEGHYTFEDVKEASRAFTGRRFDHENYPYAMYIDKNAFDNNYKTILGKTGNWNGEDVIDIILSEYQTARHISRSALIFFLGQIPSENVVDECAKVYFESGYTFEKLLRHIFFSNWFYDALYKNNKVKTPVELLVGLQRKTGMRCVGIKTTIYFLRYCGQIPFRPPHVSGWPVGEEWLFGNELVNRIFLPSTLLKLANRSNVRSSLKYKIFSRMKQNSLREFGYIFDAVFDETEFKKVLRKNGLELCSWMNSCQAKTKSLSEILQHPKYQYS